MGAGLFAVYLCRFELGLLYCLVLVVWCFYYFWKSGRLCKTWNLLYLIGIWGLLFIIHAIFMFHYTGSFITEYLAINSPAAMKINNWASRQFHYSPPSSPFPELESDMSTINWIYQIQDRMSFSEKLSRVFKTFFEPYEILLVGVYAILFFRMTKIRLSFRYETMLIVLFASTLLFFAFFSLFFEVRYMFQVVYLFIPLYARLFLFIKDQLQTVSRRYAALALIILLCPICYKGISYNIKSVAGKERSMSETHQRKVGAWIREKYSAGNIMILQDSRYALFSGNYTCIYLVDDREELFRRARMVGARLLIMNDVDVKNNPALTPIFEGADARFTLVYDQSFGKGTRVKIFEIENPGASQIKTCAIGKMRNWRALWQDSLM